MKKVFKMALIAAMACSVCGTAMAQNKKLDKLTQKEMVKQQKELIKARSAQVEENVRKYSEANGWKIDGTAKSSEVALREYYMKLNTDPNNREMTGNAVGSTSKSLNVCQNFALNNAMNKYAQEARTYVMGRVASNVGNVNETELDNFYGAYERLVSATIEGELTFQFAFYKDGKDGKREYIAFYLINEDNASKKRIKAMEDAVKETKMAQKFATDISDFVREGFRTDEAAAKNSAE